MFMADQFPTLPPAQAPAPSGDKKGLAIAGFVLGILNLCAWFLPICGGPLSVVGIVLSALGIKSSQKTLAIIGLVLSGLGLIATIINAVARAVIGIQNPEIFNSILQP
jgi:hypothetical protein